MLTAGVQGCETPVADTQDNSGAGGDSTTTGLLQALLAQGAGRRFPAQAALGLLFDAAAGRAAAGSMAAEPADLPWRHLPDSFRHRP